MGTVWVRVWVRYGKGKVWYGMVWYGMVGGKGARLEPMSSDQVKNTQSLIPNFLFVYIYNMKKKYYCKLKLQ